MSKIASDRGGTQEKGEGCSKGGDLEAVAGEMGSTNRLNEMAITIRGEVGA